MTMINRVLPAIQGHFGRDVITYQVQVDLPFITDLLGHDPRDVFKKKSPVSDEIRAIYAGVQRKVDPQRLREIGLYVESRTSIAPPIIGAFPAIAVGSSQLPEFQPLDPVKEKDFGILNVAPTPGLFRMVLDGLGRISGILDKFDEGRITKDSLTIAVTIFAPAKGAWTLFEMGQLFHDFNFLAKSVSAQHAMALDHSDIYLKLTEHISRLPVIMQNGGMEKKSHSLGQKSRALVVQKDLFRFVRGVTEGIRFQESNRAEATNPNLTPQTFDKIFGEISTLLEGFAHRMGHRFHSQENRTDLHRSSVGWQAIGLIFHDLLFNLKLDTIATDAILNKLALVDWSRYNQDWITLLGEADLNGVPSNGRYPVSITKGGRANRQHLYQYLAKATGIDSLRAVSHAAE